MHPRLTPLGRPHSTVSHKLGASSLAPFIYPAIIFRRRGSSVAPNLSVLDPKVLEDLRLMSLLKCVYVLLTPIPLPHAQC